jgi:DNA-binding GntR family transcriptional regulator
MFAAEDRSLRASIKSMPDMVYDVLRQEIISGVLQPAQPLKQAHIASRLNLSLGPVREALQRLESEGLVVSRSHRGYQVSSLDASEIDDMFELRIWIESRTAQLAAVRRSESDVALMESLLAQMEAAVAKSPPDYYGWALLNRRFHGHLFEISGRHQLCRMAKTVLDVIERYIWFDYGAGEGLREAQREHREIVEAFKARDGARVQILTQNHSQHTRQRLLDTLSERGS